MTDDAFEALFAVLERGAVALERSAAAAEHLAIVVTAAWGPAEPEPCAHPVEERRDCGSTMGHERWVCKLCGHEVGS